MNKSSILLPYPLGEYYGENTVIGGNRLIGSGTPDSDSGMEQKLY